MLPGSAGSTWLPATQIWDVVWRALHPSLSSIFNWIRIKKISCSCSADGGLTVSKSWSGKAMASCSYTKGWNWVHSTGPAQKKRQWRSHRSSTSISCRDWKLLHAIRSRKSDRIRSYKILCKTEKIKKYLPIIISPEKELSTFHDSAAFIYSGVLSGPFTGLVDKYSEKPEKLIVFWVFQSIHLLVKMTDTLSAGFAFSLSLRYNRNIR